MRRDSAAHKRLILLGTTELLGAGERADDGVFWPQVRFDRELFVHEV